MKKTHIENLLEHVPDLLKRKFLDVGSGRGEVIVEVFTRGGSGVGVECYDKYIEITKALAQEKGVDVDIWQGYAEKLPFEDASFGFVNLAEVIEHVNDPYKVMSETYRVLEKGGFVYVSVPSRFSFFDVHFHMYFINWLPRKWSNFFINLLGKRKSDTGETGRQKLDEMHYYTFFKVKKMMKNIGFLVFDSREDIFKKKWRNKKLPFIGVALLIYRIIQPFYFGTFHFLLKK
ncbi:MAG: class I SAM-dependent methyltransferase [Candidatus Pacebacteria bacterium]|nr:class I SAM-dependent methyltransferase [Candidatus Paceibacterota bacterium]